jgi:hypothetical protein
MRSAIAIFVLGNTLLLSVGSPGVAQSSRAMQICNYVNPQMSLRVKYTFVNASHVTEQSGQVALPDLGSCSDRIVIGSDDDTDVELAATNAPSANPVKTILHLRGAGLLTGVEYVLNCDGLGSGLCAKLRHSSP